jgi:hypothetical protein
MKKILIVILMFLSNWSQAQQAPPIEEINFTNQAQFLSWAYKTQLSTTGKLFMIASAAPNAEMGLLIDRLTHGWTDCTGTFLCINAPVYGHQNVQVFTGNGLEAAYEPLTILKYVPLPWGWAWRSGELYLNGTAPNTAIWLWETPAKDYMVTGTLLEGRGTAVKILQGLGIAKAIKESMMIGRILQSARKNGGGQYTGTVEKLYDAQTYTGVLQLAERMNDAVNITIIGKLGKPLIDALQQSRGFGIFGNPIKAIVGKSQVGQYGPCNWWSFQRMTEYFVMPVEPSGGFILINDGINSEVISGALITSIGTEATIGLKGVYAQRILEQLNIQGLMNQAQWTQCR